MSGFVYAIGQGFEQPVKIGVASDVGRRLATIQAGNPADLRVMLGFANPLALQRRGACREPPSRRSRLWRHFRRAEGRRLNLSTQGWRRGGPNASELPSLETNEANP